MIVAQDRLESITNARKLATTVTLQYLFPQWHPIDRLISETQFVDTDGNNINIIYIINIYRKSLIIPINKMIE